MLCLARLHWFFMVDLQAKYWVQDKTCSTAVMKDSDVGSPSQRTQLVSKLKMNTSAEATGDCLFSEPQPRIAANPRSFVHCDPQSRVADYDGPDMAQRPRPPKEILVITTAVRRGTTVLRRSLTNVHVTPRGSFVNFGACHVTFWGLFVKSKDVTLRKMPKFPFLEPLHPASVSAAPLRKIDYQLYLRASRCIQCIERKHI